MRAKKKQIPKCIKKIKEGKTKIRWCLPPSPQPRMNATSVKYYSTIPYFLKKKKTNKKKTDHVSRKIKEGKNTSPINGELQCVVIVN